MTSEQDTQYEQVSLPFIAGLNDEDEPVFEAVEVEIVGEETVNEKTHVIARLLKSPLLARNYAAGDKLKIIDMATAQYELVQRSGNLAIRVFCREDMESLAQTLIPAFEKLDGTLDSHTDRALVFSIHFSIGFTQIEEILNAASADYPYMVWYYGNVYDPEDGTTPLGWWSELEKTL